LISFKDQFLKVKSSTDLQKVTLVVMLMWLNQIDLKLLERKRVI